MRRVKLSNQGSARTRAHGCRDGVCVFRGHCSEDFISLSSSSISEVLSALISLYLLKHCQGRRGEPAREGEIAWVLPHHPRNIDCLIAAALELLINTTGVMEAEKRSDAEGRGERGMKKERRSRGGLQWCMSTGGFFFLHRASTLNVHLSSSEFVKGPESKIRRHLMATKHNTGKFINNLCAFLIFFAAELELTSSMTSCQGSWSLIHVQRYI